MPCVPLILSSIQLPKIPGVKFLWILTWIVFNAGLGLLMGVYHQGGVVPSQTYISAHLENATHVIWWKTYSPPTWLLGEMNEHCQTIDLMGAKREVVFEKLHQEKGGCTVGNETTLGKPSKSTYLVAPIALNIETETTENGKSFRLDRIWVYRNHLGLDDLDMDIEKDGILGAISKVIESRGIGIWRVVDPQELNCIQGGH